MELGMQYKLADKQFSLDDKKEKKEEQMRNK